MAIQYEQQLTFKSTVFQAVVDPEHRLIRLSEEIDWPEIHGRLRGYYSTVGRQGLPVRLMVGIHFLKHMEDLSDEQCVDRIQGDLYWMAFCGVDPEGLEGRYRHLDRTSMTKFRNRIGPSGWAEVESVIREHLLRTERIDPKVMTTDSTCMEKNIAYPVDSYLLDKARRNLLKGMERLEELGVAGVKGLRTFRHRAKRVLITMIKLGKDRSERIQKGTLELASQAVHVIGKCEEMIERAHNTLKEGEAKFVDSFAVEGWIKYLEEQRDLARRVVIQSRLRFQGIHVPDKIYSLHEPQVIVVRKGKRSRQNEYGSKVNVSIDSSGYIVSHETYFENKSDTKLLEPAIKNWEKTTGKMPQQLNADRGYAQKQKNIRGKIRNVKRLCIPKLGKTKHPDAEKEWFRKGQSTRAGCEAVIGHLKQDHRLDRSRYTGHRGDKTNVALSCMAWNLKKLAREAA